MTVQDVCHEPEAGIPQVKEACCVKMVSRVP